METHVVVDHRVGMPEKTLFTGSYDACEAWVENRYYTDDPHAWDHFGIYTLEEVA